MMLFNQLWRPSQAIESAKQRKKQQVLARDFVQRTIEVHEF